MPDRHTHPDWCTRPPHWPTNRARCPNPRFEGWGTSLGWWANVVGGYTNRDAYADLAFNGLKLNIVRYNIGGGENPGITNTLQPRARMQGFEATRGSWNWSADPNQRWI